MVYTLVWKGRNPLPGPDGVVVPYEPFRAPRQWAREYEHHRLQTLEEYNLTIERMGREQLQNAIKRRRDISDEDLSASGSTDELRDRLKYDVDKVEEQLDEGE